MSTLLCVPILAPDTATALREARAAKDGGADLVEFRIDDVFHGDGSPDDERAIAQLIDSSPLPCIVTCRAASEGGHYDGPEDARVSLYQWLGTAEGVSIPPRYIDVELSTYQRSANIQQKVHLAVGYPDERRDLQSSLILSTHDFKGRPHDLSRRILAMRSLPAAKVLKIAYLARSLRDNLELFDVLADRDRPTIALAMGEPGLMSRVLAPKFGGFLTFASLRPTTTTAPGQPTLSDLLNIYRFRSINKETAVYGVVGHPVAHSLSPHIHNAGFEAINLNAVYLPLPVAPGYESFKASVLELIHYTPLNLRGLSVTLPHKENLVRLAQEQGWHLDEVSTATGAANTLAIESAHPSRIRILNTDALALLSTLQDEAGQVAGKRIAILGAGGVGKSAAISLAAAGASVTLFNRTYDRAAALAESLNPVSHGQIAAGDLAGLPHTRFDAYINCTPIGMKHGPGPEQVALPVAEIAKIAPGAIVMDTIYNPLDTPLLRAARESGLRPISGLPMFIGQAAAQFFQWTGHTAPAQLFDRIAREQLAAH